MVTADGTLSLACKALTSTHCGGLNKDSARTCLVLLSILTDNKVEEFADAIDLFIDRLSQRSENPGTKRVF